MGVRAAVRPVVSSVWTLVVVVTVVVVWWCSELAAPSRCRRRPVDSVRMPWSASTHAAVENLRLPLPSNNNYSS